LNIVIGPANFVILLEFISIVFYLFIYFVSLHIAVHVLYRIWGKCSFFVLK